MQILAKALLLLTLPLFLFSCLSSRNIGQTSIRSIRFLGEYNIPAAEKFRGTTVGGLSGIDYDAKRNQFYLICDDRADTNYMRYYTAKASLSNQGIQNFKLVDVTKLLKGDGQPFHNRKQSPFDVPDPEAIRYHPPTQQLFWSSEGERTSKNGNIVLTDPAIFISSRRGEWVDTFPLPANLRMSSQEKGPRNNGAFEGLTFSPDLKKLFVSLEEPLLEDGPRAGLFDSSAWVRFQKYDVATRRPEAQYAYRIDPVVQEPISEGLFVVNGVTDILAISDSQMLVTERSFSTGRLSTNIKIYLAELNGADDITGYSSLMAAPPFKYIKKTLLLNMDHLGRLVDNIEGASFGPRLANGKWSLLFIADNNFSARQKNQLLLFEIE